MNMTEQILELSYQKRKKHKLKMVKLRNLLKTFPGYVLVELVMTDQSWYVVRNTPGVTGFVGSAGAGSKPNPLLPEEVRFILKQMGLKEKLLMLNLMLVNKFVSNQDLLLIK